MSSTKTQKPLTLETQKEQAKDYLEKHNLLPILQQITASLIHEMPESPKEHVSKLLEQIRAARSKGQNLNSFTPQNLGALFLLFDPTGKGHITGIQYKEAMRSLGATKANPSPSGFAQDKITKEVFIEEANQALRRL